MPSRPLYLALGVVISPLQAFIATKCGDDYLRTLLIQGATSAVITAGKRSDRISP